MAAMSRRENSVAYHEAGHITAAVVLAMPIETTGLQIDLCGHGCAGYFSRLTGDLAVTEVDLREREFTIITLYAAHTAQLRFDPDCRQDNWRSDLEKAKALVRELHSTQNEEVAAHDSLRRRAAKLVGDHWPIIAELATVLLSKACVPLSQEDTKWGMGSHKRQMMGAEIVEFFAQHNIRAKIIHDSKARYDSTQDTPPYKG
ncbi:MAG TPA: hypothetical protein VGD60_14275 [Candidatus Acidoferrales bacterium]